MNSNKLKKSKRTIKIALIDFSNKELKILKDKILKKENIKNYDTDSLIDAYFSQCNIIIVKYNEKKMKEYKSFFCLLDGVNPIDDIIIFVGNIEIPKGVKRVIRVIDSFEDLEMKIKYIILNAEKENKKNSDYSKTIMYSIRIMRLINGNPGITTREIVEKLGEITERQVLRYIRSLNLAGEIIIQDTNTRGWKYMRGYSELIADTIVRYKKEMENEDGIC